MDIHHEETGSKGRYWTRLDGGPEAELTYSRAGAGMIIIDHTEVPDAYRVKGVGVALVEHAVNAAREGGWTILPLCPFAAAQFRRHAEWHDVLKRKEQAR